MSLVKHILEIDSVELSFGERQILSSAYICVKTGSVTALLGRNGSGKSCIMRVLSGGLRADFRSMRIDSVWHDKFSNKQVLYLAQDCSIPNYLKVDTLFRDFNLEFEDFAEVFPVFRFVRKKRIGELSGGEKRILEIFVVIKANSQFALLDEPFSQIMPLHISTIKSLIIQEKERKGILITDHMYRDVVDIADSIYVMANETIYLTKNREDLVRYGYINKL